MCHKKKSNLDLLCPLIYWLDNCRKQSPLPLALSWQIQQMANLMIFCCSSSLCLKPCYVSSALGSPWKDLYVEYLVIIAESLEKCVRRLLTWNETMKEKGLRVNAGKTKIMICGTGLDLLQSSDEFPCAVCRTGVGCNSIFCNGCKHWVHKTCSWHKHDKGPWLQMYTVPENCTPLGRQTTEESPSRTW